MDPAERVRASSPRPGKPLVTSVERLAGPVREVTRRLAQILAVDPTTFSILWGPRAGGLGFSTPGKDGRLAHRAARCLVAEWLVGYAMGEVHAASSLADAHAWWTAGLPLASLLAVPPVTGPWPGGGSPDPAQVMALLPYLLDPAAPGTRRDILRGSQVHGERRQRKAGGVYFTPGDVAHFMVGGLAGDRHPATWLDPASGTGVFLRAALETCPDSQVFGIDVDPMAAELAAFVLAATVRAGSSPWLSWHLHRLNLVTGNALAIDRPGRPAQRETRRADERSQARTALRAGQVHAPAAPSGVLGESDLWSLSAALPEMAAGPDAIIQNPPYAALPAQRNTLLADRWGGRLPSNMYPLFLELGLSLLPDSGRFSAVVPASLVTSSVSSLRESRRLLAATAGDLEILSFDRAPDGLFGDDIKTRCCVIFLDKDRPAALRLGPLRRITSHNRQAALVRGTGVRLPPEELHAPLPPKLGSAAEWILLQAVRAAPSSVQCLVTAISAQPLIGQANDTPGILIAPTAYNWLNVIRRPAVARAAGHDSTHPFLHLRVYDEQTADAVYAILSSRLALWLWRVFGDGFHVGRWLLNLVPAPAGDDLETLNLLAKLGADIWASVAQAPVKSRNGGRVTVGFPPGPGARVLVDEVDRLLTEGIGLSEPPLSLGEWSRAVAAVGRIRERTGAAPW